MRDANGKREIHAAAAAERGLSDEEDVSDDDSVVTHDTVKWSFCTRSEFVTNDVSSTRERRFFFRFIKDIMTTLRHIESSDYYQGNHKENTNNFKTDTENRKCLVPECNQTHKNKANKSSQNLGLCKKI